MPADQKLSVKVEGDELVIRIGIDTLAYSAEQQDFWWEWDSLLGKFVPLWKVIDNNGWAEEVVRELNKEEEDGSTPLTNFLDKIFNTTLDQGSLSVWSPELGTDDPDGEE